MQEGGLWGQACKRCEQSRWRCGAPAVPTCLDRNLFRGPLWEPEAPSPHTAPGRLKGDKTSCKQVPDVEGLS